MLFISHDLAIVERIADRVAVMYLGRIVELGSAETVLGTPRHPYTRGLLAAAPRIDAVLDTSSLLQGEPPDPAAPPSGCRFPAHPLSAARRGLCAAEEPVLSLLDGGRAVACHFPEPIPTALEVH